MDFDIFTGPLHWPVNFYQSRYTAWILRLSFMQNIFSEDLRKLPQKKPLEISLVYSGRKQETTGISKPKNKCGSINNDTISKSDNLKNTIPFRVC